MTRGWKSELTLFLRFLFALLFFFKLLFFASLFLSFLAFGYFGVLIPVVAPNQPSYPCVVKANNQ